MQSNPIRALVALDAGVDDGRVRALLSNAADIEVTGLVHGLEAGWTAVQEHACDVVILACPPSSDSALWFLRELVRAEKDQPVIVLSDGSPNGFVRHAFEAGADDVLVLASGGAGGDAMVAEQLRFALEKAVARRTGAAQGGGTALGSMICVLGPKGGIGKTLTSGNLGIALAAEGRTVAIVDLDLQFGVVGLSLVLSPDRTVYYLVKSGGSLDVEMIEAYLTPHPSGARVLVAPVRPDQAAAVTIEFLRELYPLLRASHDFVVVDTPPGFSPEVIASIDSSTDVCMVGMLDSLSLKNMKLGLETLELMGYERGRIRVVLNRADTNVGVTLDDVTAIIGSPPDVAIPSHRDVVRSINEGRPIVLSRPRSEVAKAFRSLAAGYLGQSATRSARGLRLRRKG
jgi:pilus assembly protein CpaE